MKRYFHFSQIQYVWLLLTSMLLFVVSLYVDRANPETAGPLEWCFYGSAVACAFVWSALNYVAHIKVNALYKKGNSIDAYVGGLTMSPEEKEDLRAYLNDFVKDMEDNGKTHEDAVKSAIAQFQVQEFTSLTGTSGLLDLPAHHYLAGMAVVLAAAFLLTRLLIGIVFPHVFLLHVLSFMFALYAVSFVGLMLLYKLIDVSITKKIMYH